MRQTLYRALHCFSLLIITASCNSRMTSRIVAPLQLLSTRDTVQIGITVGELQVSRPVQKGSYGGWYEIIHSNKYFDMVSYLDSDDIVIRATLSRDPPGRRSSVSIIGDISNICDAYYKQSGAAFIRTNRNGLHQTIKTWDVQGQHVCLFYDTVDDSIRNGSVDSATVILIIGCRSTQWTQDQDSANNAM